MVVYRILVVQDHLEQVIMDRQPAVIAVIDKAKHFELIHEMTDSGQEGFPIDWLSFLISCLKNLLFAENPLYVKGNRFLAMSWCQQAGRLRQIRFHSLL